ncbi:MAG: hypothetical protein CNE89_13225 [Sphingomonadaceae bacterium MED-G03]|nr:MAG: hypothetical protein CNE89_13225 [Sphingomonadaceae bacterium MED-G03]
MSLPEKQKFVPAPRPLIGGPLPLRVRPVVPAARPGLWRVGDKYFSRLHTRIEKKSAVAIAQQRR